MADLDADGALAEAVRLRRGADAAEARLLRVAAHWADLHAVLPEDTRGGGAAGHRSRTVIGGTERLVPLAGPGAPAVAEFAPAELGAALGMSTHAAGVLVGNALELRHRLPRLWARVMAGRLPARRAGKIAEHTKTLSADAAGYVDAQLAPVAHRIGLARVLALVAAAMKRFDPEQAAEQERRAAATSSTTPAPPPSTPAEQPHPDVHPGVTLPGRASACPRVEAAAAPPRVVANRRHRSPWRAALPAV